MLKILHYILSKKISPKFWAANAPPQMTLHVSVAPTSRLMASKCLHGLGTEYLVRLHLQLTAVTGRSQLHSADFYQLRPQDHRHGTRTTIISLSCGLYCDNHKP